jgi:hypothetical protein
MRHLGSIVLSLLLGPIVYAFVGVGLVKVTGAPTDWYKTDPAPVLTGLAAYAVAGLLFAVLTMTRISPLGPVLVGLGYAGITAWALFGGTSITDALAFRIGDSDEVLIRPAYGVALLLAVPLLATIVSPRRWRRSVSPPPAAAADQEQDTPAYPTSPALPAYPSTPAPIYTPTSRLPADDVPAGPGERTTVLSPPSPPVSPVSSPPAQDAPTSGAPTSGAPTSGAPTSGAPTSGAPAQSSPNAVTQTWPVSDGTGDQAKGADHPTGADQETTRKLSQ